MPILPHWNRSPDRTLILLAGVALLLFLVEHLNGRFWLNDFRVYYGAAQALLNGEPLYGVAHGLDSGVFKYAPVMALLFVPLALLPYGLAASIHYVGIVAAFLGALIMADRLLREHLLNGRASSHAVLMLTALVVIVHLHRELHLGNINAMLLWLLLLALAMMLHDRNTVAGLLLGLAVIAKPHFVVLLPLLFLRGRWHALIVASVTLVACTLLPALFLGYAANMDLHREWLDQMARHNASLIYTGGEGYEAVNTVYSFLWRAMLGPLGVEATQQLAFSMLVLIALAFATFVWWNKRHGRPTDEALTMEYLLLVALVPSLTLTDTEHFLLAMPLVAWLVHHLVPLAANRWLPWMAAPVLFAYGGNWEDALGALSDRMVHYGVLGIGNLGLLVLAIYLFQRRGSHPGASHVSNGT